MKKPNERMEKRRFLKILAASGLGAPAIGSMAQAADSSETPATTSPLTGGTVPTRKLGKTGLDVSCLTFGCTSPKKDDLFSKTLDLGITHWHSASSYSGAEASIGGYLKRNPDVRNKILLSTKPADITTPTPIISDLEAALDKSLKDCGTDHFDIYFGIHAMPKPTCLSDELRQFAEAAKKAGKIRFFGFSCHAGMYDNLTTASSLDWIDVIMSQYSYRFGNNTKVQTAIDACVKANIALIAIKVQGFGAKTMNEEEKKLTNHFIERGFDEAQAKTKYVLEDPRFSSVAIGVKSIEILESCTAAALDKVSLASNDIHALHRHARESCSSYCTGCPNICGAALPEGLPLMSDIMRYLMYSHNHGEHAHARTLFNQLPTEMRARMLAVDYRQAEAVCPQRIPIAGMVAEAFERFV